MFCKPMNYSKQLMHKSLMNLDELVVLLQQTLTMTVSKISSRSYSGICNIKYYYPQFFMVSAAHCNGPYKIFSQHFFKLITLEYS